MTSDFFLGFAGHAHTKNEVGTDPNSEMELRNRNNPKEAQELTESILDKIEKVLKGDAHLDGLAKKTQDPFKILISTILSARTRDANTKAATETLFKKYNTPGLIANADIEDLEPLVRKAGFYKVKWSGNNKNGNYVANGLYFYRMVAQTAEGKVFAKTKKMIYVGYATKIAPTVWNIYCQILSVGIGSG